MITPAQIQRILSIRQPSLLQSENPAKAAVALILRFGTSGLEVLFIERAHHDGDPWSGNLGFPGGRLESFDAGPREAAIRETMEEIGLDLRTALHLGRMDDIATASIPVQVSCFVYLLNDSPRLRPNHEVRSTYWIPLKDISNPNRRMEAIVHFGGRKLVRPAIDVLGPGEIVLWGLTYRLILQFIELVEGSNA